MELSQTPIVFIELPDSAWGSTTGSSCCCSASPHRRQANSHHSADIGNVHGIAKQWECETEILLTLKKQILLYA